VHDTLCVGLIEWPSSFDPSPVVMGVFCVCVGRLVRASEFELVVLCVWVSWCERRNLNC